MSRIINNTRRLLIITLAIVFVSGFYGSCTRSTLKPVEIRLGEAWVKTRGDKLIANTGKVQRVWKWTGHGFVTTSLKNLSSGKEWVNTSPAFGSDWSLEGLVAEDTEAFLVGITAKQSTDQGFTSEHIETVAKIAYPQSKITVRYLIWVYPGANGIRTQLQVKGMAGFTPPEPLDSPDKGGFSSRVDYIPLTFGNAVRRAIGYYNHTQGRNKKETEILEEMFVSTPLADEEVYDWASVMNVEDDSHGLLLVKESHKCVNQMGYQTGAFHCSSSGLSTSGWGISPEEILTERFRACWAIWSILYAGGEDQRELALKVFDRIRYPIDPERDIYIMANTWGSTAEKSDAQKAAREENVLVEIASQADLGIDVQQVDDGWQGNKYDNWRTVAERYPDGWTNVRMAAREKGITMGLWAAGQRIPLEDLKHNFDQGDFRYYKLDFVNLRNYQQIEEFFDKIRAFVLYTDHKVRINYDVTENPPRVGYFFAREYGNIYLENRKPVRPPHVVYQPCLVLRDAWQVAKYLNLNKFQVTVQNIDRVDRQASDAYLHNHPYCVAITLMGSPIFFQETHYYTDEARDQIRPLLALYKKHREEMYRNYVFPFGEKPDNGSWVGFQNYNPEDQSGYLTVFRELNAPESAKALALRFIAGEKIRLIDLREETERIVDVAADGRVTFNIDSAPDFRFYRYECIE